MDRPDPDAARPGGVFDPALQHERTGQAWERTAISMMVAGVLLARYAAQDAHAAVAAVGLAQVVIGGVLLVWSGRRYHELHAPLREGGELIHRSATRLVGAATIVFSLAALVLALLIT